MNRISFVKTCVGVGATLFVGSRLLGNNSIFEALGQPSTNSISFHITDAIKDMVTANAVNPRPANCYFWLYKDTNPATNLPPEVPGPTIFAVEGDTIEVTLTNELDENHNFAIPAAGIFSPIVTPPGTPDNTKTFSLTVPVAGTYLYYDSLNVPVNRVMGLHGAFISMPASPSGTKFTPYNATSVTPAVQALFDDLGSQPWWPGLAWEEGATNPPVDGVTVPATPPFRQYVWILHQASPNLFKKVGDHPAGQDFPVADFIKQFARDAFSIDSSTSGTPQYFTIDGQSGHFSHSNPFICPNLRVGECCVIRLLNAGLMAHSTHIHANHMYMLYYNGTAGLDIPPKTRVQENLIWIDVFTSHPLDVYDWLNPYMRPPDHPNIRGIGRADTPLTSIANPDIPGSAPHPVWPPFEEIAMFIPANLKAKDIDGNVVGLNVQLSPLCYPMHDHSEPSQTSQGGNYNLGLISGMNFTGDRNTPGGVTTFPNFPTIFGPDKNKLIQPPAGE